MESRGAVPRGPVVVTIVAHDVAPAGGMERQLSELIQRLLETGAHVTLVSRTCRLDSHARLRWIRVPGPARPFVVAYPWFFLAGSLLVRRHRRGVVHTTGAIVVNKADISSVHLCHHSPAVRDLRRSSRTGLLYRVNTRLGAPLSRLGERLVYRPGRTKVLVAVSESVASDLRRAFPRLADNIRVVPNGVDSQRFRPDRTARDDVRRELGIADDELVALFVGSEWEAKGLALAVQAVASLADCRLVVVGRGDRERYARLAAAAGAVGRVLFVGVTAAPERHYAAADVFVLPSEYETFSLVAYEAAAAGLPLIVSNCDAFAQLVVDGVNGWLVELDAHAIATRIATLRSEPDRRARMGEAARAASLRFGWGAVAERYAALYDCAKARTA